MGEPGVFWFRLLFITNSATAPPTSKSLSMISIEFVVKSLGFKPLTLGFQVRWLTCQTTAAARTRMRSGDSRWPRRSRAGNPSRPQIWIFPPKIGRKRVRVWGSGRRPRRRPPETGIGTGTGSRVRRRKRMEKSFKKVTAWALDSGKVVTTAGLGARCLTSNLAQFLLDVELQHCTSGDCCT